MKLSMGENIKRMRMERSLTQEEVATHLGVSAQSVSKWERGEGYPDIELLPAISHYFGVSIDELLGTSEKEKEQSYNALNEKWMKNNKSGAHEENVSLMRDALKSFPNDPLLLVQLSTSLEKLDGTEEEKEKYLRESVAVQEQIINYCPDCEVRGAVLFNICFAYSKIGEREKALLQARKLSNLYKARENALSYFLEGEERKKNSGEAVYNMAWVIAHHMNVLAEEEKNPLYRKRAREILDILFEEKDAHIQKMYDSLN